VVDRFSEQDEWARNRMAQRFQRKLHHHRVHGFTRPGAINYTGDGRGIDDTPFSSARNHTFSHMKIWDWESGVYIAGANYPIFEYIEMYNIMAANWSTYHRTVYTSSVGLRIVRYSKFRYGVNGCGRSGFFRRGIMAPTGKYMGTCFTI